MPYTGNHVLLAWGGKMPGAEIWSNTLRMRDVTTAAQFPEADTVDGWLQGGFKNALTTFWNAIRLTVGQNTTLEWMKANRVGTNGKYLDPGTNLYTFNPVLTGGSSSNRPNQLALAVTTGTAVDRGRAHAGRFFLPCGVLTVDGTTGQIPVSDANAIATAAAAFIASLNNTAKILTVDIIKAAVMSNVGEGTHHDITHVRVGRIVDTQRRRRNKALEAPVSANLP